MNLILAYVGVGACVPRRSASVEAIHNAAVGAALVHWVLSTCAASARPHAGSRGSGLIRNTRFVY